MNTWDFFITVGVTIGGIIGTAIFTEWFYRNWIK